MLNNVQESAVHLPSATAAESVTRPGRLATTWRRDGQHIGGASSVAPCCSVAGRRQDLEIKPMHHQRQT